MLNEMTINGVDISAYNARLQSYSVSGTTVTNNLSASRSFLTAPTLFSAVPGTRTLSLTLLDGIRPPCNSNRKYNRI